MEKESKKDRKGEMGVMYQEGFFDEVTFKLRFKEVRHTDAYGRAF